MTSVWQQCAKVHPVSELELVPVALNFDSDWMGMPTITLCKASKMVNPDNIFKGKCVIVRGIVCERVALSTS